MLSSESDTLVGTPQVTELIEGSSAPASSTLTKVRREPCPTAHCKTSIRVKVPSSARLAPERRGGSLKYKTGDRLLSYRRFARSNREKSASDRCLVIPRMTSVGKSQMSILVVLTPGEGYQGDVEGEDMVDEITLIQGNPHRFKGRFGKRLRRGSTGWFLVAPLGVGGAIV